MRLKVLIAAAAALALLGSSATFAQAPAPTDKPAAAADSQPMAKMKKAKKPRAARSAKSIDCSKQADEQKLHGKPRQKFRAKCMKG